MIKVSVTCADDFVIELSSSLLDLAQQTRVINENLVIRAFYANLSMGGEVGDSLISFYYKMLKNTYCL